MKTYKLAVTPHFRKQIKPLIKKNRGLEKVLHFELHHFEPKLAVSLGNKFFKLRLRGSNKGKSSSYRAIIFVEIEDRFIVPICIYSKSETETLSMEKIKEQFKIVLGELRISTLIPPPA